MSNNCIHKHPSGQYCGLPRVKQSSYCQFHWLYYLGSKLLISETEPVKSYISESNTQRPGEPVIFDGIRFQNVQFGLEISVIPLRASFKNSRFENCNFSNSTLQDVVFEGAKFINTIFNSSKFIGRECSFHMARFNCTETIFESCHFNLKAPHPETTRVSFSYAEMKTQSHPFSFTVMETDILAMHDVILESRFFRITLLRPSIGLGLEKTLTLAGPISINLSNLEFYGSFLFSNHLDALEEAPKVQLTNINFSAMRQVQFYRANLKDVWFTGSALESVKFDNCLWPIKEGYKHLREDEVDENLAVKNSEALIAQYTRLKKNFEDARDYIGAGDWFYREMEIRRREAEEDAKKLKKTFPIHLIAIKIYKFVSNYGENYMRPLKGILLVWFFFAPLYLVGGFSIGDETIKYYFCPSCGFKISIVLDFLKALLASGAAMALQIGKVINFESAWSVFFFIFQILFTAVVLPLFLLALRRKFRR